MAVRDCVVPGCSRSAPNSLGVRLRKPPQADAWWSPNTGAYVCDVHAKRKRGSRREGDRRRDGRLSPP